MTYSMKDYYCPTCGLKTRQGTNHTGEIYIECPKCHSNVQYCSDTIREDSDGRCVLICYNFDIKQPEQAEGYDRLRNILTEKNYKKFNVMDNWQYREALQQYDYKALKVYNKEQFKDQFVTVIGRLHNWYESCVPNKDIRKGYYLEWEE